MSKRCYEFEYIEFHRLRYMRCLGLWTAIRFYIDLQLTGNKIINIKRITPEP